MNIKKIYIDMDGVLADFDHGIRELCGITELMDLIDNDKVWECVKKVDHFYDKLNLIEGADKLINLLFDRYGDLCEILSAVPRKEKGISTAKEDKENWLRRNIDITIKSNYVYSGEKSSYCKGADYILIDDSYDNIREWEKAGGIAIHFSSIEDALKELDIIENIILGKLSYDEVIQLDIENLLLGRRHEMSFKRNGINKVADLFKERDHDVWYHRTLGRKSLDVLVARLKMMGITLEK